MPAWRACTSFATTATPGLANNPITLPSGAQEVELLVQDRQFDTNGQLLFPDGTPADNPTGLNGGVGNPDKHPFWIPEFFGDVITVNGKSWPTLECSRAATASAFVNGSNARFLIMQLFNQQGVDMHVNGPVGPVIWQIGSDGGFLNNPVKLGDPANGRDACAGEPVGNNTDVTASARCLTLAPAERADVIIDFAGQAGKTFTMKNFAVIPFPSGGPVGFGAPDATSDGLVMQFNVNQPLQGTDTTFNPAARNHPALRASPMVNIKPANGRGDKLRQLILVEEEGNSLMVDGPGSPDADGEPVEALINNTKWNGNREGTTIQVPGSTSNGRGVSATETPQEGLDRGLGGRQPDRRRPPDAHPPDPVPGDFAPELRRGHLPDRLDRGVPGRHLQWGSPSRRACTYLGSGRPCPTTPPTRRARSAGTSNFDAAKYLQQGACAGGACPSRAPDGSDSGWKDTIKMYPGEIARIALRWAPQKIAAGASRPGQDLFSFDPTNGPRLRRALPHPRPRRQRVHASVADRAGKPKQPSKQVNNSPGFIASPAFPCGERKEPRGGGVYRANLKSQRGRLW